MRLIQILLPLHNNAGLPFAQELYRQVKNELVDRFGGITAYQRAPASGLWVEDEGRAVRDEILIYEVMTEDLDLPWWRQYRKQLEARFEQETLVIRASEIRLL